MPVVWKSTVKRDQLNREEVPSLASEVLRETFAQAYEELPILPGGMFDRRRELESAESTFREGKPFNTRITAQQAMERVKKNGLEGHLTFDKDTTAEAVDLLSERKRKELYRQDIASRSPGGFGLGTAKFGLAVGTSLADPASALLNFVPVVNQARYARWLKYGSNAAGAFGRAGVRAGAGAIEGVVGAALYEPFLYSAKQGEQADYHMSDSLLNVAFGGITGGGIHMIGGLSADAYRALRGIEQPWAEKSALSNAITAGMAAREKKPVPITAEMIERGGKQLDEAIDASLGAAADPVTRFAPNVIRSVDETGEHRAIATVNGEQVGLALAQENGPYLQMKRIDVDEAARGKGIAQEVMIELAREADARGLQLASDVSVSPDQVRVYEALERRGFTLERNPDAKINPETGNLVSHDPRSPVFKIGSEPVFKLGRVPEKIAARTPRNAAEHVAHASLKSREAALRTATTQLAEGDAVDVASLYPGSDKSPAMPDPDTSVAKTERVDAEIREGDDSLESAEEFAKLEEQQLATQAKLMDIDIKPLMEAAENEAQRIDMYAQAAELAQVCLVRGG